MDAEILGGVMRVAFLLSAAMNGILPRMALGASEKKVVLTVPRALNSLASDRVTNRLKQLAKLLGKDASIAWRD